jgi:hypothetical protein
MAVILLLNTWFLIPRGQAQAPSATLLSNENAYKPMPSPDGTLHPSASDGGAEIRLRKVHSRMLYHFARTRAARFARVGFCTPPQCGVLEQSFSFDKRSREILS